jgi:hypothetical protein
MQIPVLICFTLFGFLLPQKPSYDVYSVIDRAMKKDNSAFANDHLAAAFALWQERFNIRAIEVDSTFVREDFDLVWMSPISSVKRTTEKVIMAFSRSSDRKIVDIRNLLSVGWIELSALERQVLELVERFAWCYEIGRDSFLEDFLFPGHISIRYAGHENQKDILQNLHSKFGRTLPIRSINWENNGSRFLIRLNLDSPIRPLELSVDIQRYIAARFFDSTESALRIQALKDSLVSLNDRVLPVKSRDELIVKAPSAQQAISKVLDYYFQNHDLSILKEDQNYTIIEAYLPPFEDLIPLRLNYMITAVLQRPNEFAIHSIWLPDTNFIKNVYLSHEQKKMGWGSGSKYSAVTINCVSQTIRRYSSLALPLAFQPKSKTSTPFNGKIILNHINTDSLFYSNSQNFIDALRWLSQGMLTYYFLRDVSIQDNQCLVTGYGIWRYQNQMSHRIAKIQDSYFFQEEIKYLHQINIEIYPYVRTENVKALLSVPEVDSRRHGKIQIRN